MERQEFMTLHGLTRGIPPDLEQEANHLKKEQSASWRPGVIMVQCGRTELCKW